jgi:hypothetical protein
MSCPSEICSTLSITDIHVFLGNGGSILITTNVVECAISSVDVLRASRQTWLHVLRVCDGGHALDIDVEVEV